MLQECQTEMSVDMLGGMEEADTGEQQLEDRVGICKVD